MPGFYQRTLRDYDDEKTQFRVHVPTLNAGNMAAQLVLQANLGAAINNMVLGSLVSIRYGNEVINNAAAPNDPFAQRETKWLIGYRATIGGGFYTCELGTADLSNLNPNNRKSAFIGDGGDVDAFVDAFEAYVVSPINEADPVVIEYIRPVGRNT